MGGNIPGGKFLGGDFPGGNFPGGGVWWVGIFRVGVFLIPKTRYLRFFMWNLGQYYLPRIWVGCSYFKMSHEWLN